MGITVSSSVSIRWVIVTLLVGGSLTGVAALDLARGNETRAQEAVTAAAERLNHDIVERLTLYQYGLRGARGMVLTTGETGLTRAGFRRYSLSRDIDREFPGARGFGFIRRVPADQEESFLAQARADGHPNFSVHRFATHPGESYVIQYIEPVERNAQAIGLDIASEANRREAAQAAIDTGEARMSGPITLVQTTGARLQSMLILLPVYRSGQPPATVAERWAEAFGWTYAPLNVSEVLNLLLFDRDLFLLTLSDITEPGIQEVFYTSAPGTLPALSAPRARLDQEIFGRRWRLDLTARPAFAATLNQTSPLLVWLLGGIASLGAAALAGAWASARERAVQIRNTQSRLATIVETSGDAIVSQSLEGRILSWNRGAERLFGFTEAEAIGQTVADLLVPPERHLEDARLLARAAQGEEGITAFETVRRRQDGSLVEVALTASPLHDDKNQRLGLALHLRDIGSQKAAERRLTSFNAHLEQQVAARTAELEAARRILQTVLDAVPSLIGYWDRDLTCRFANKAYAHWFGAEPERLQGIPLRTLLGDAFYDQSRPMVEAALSGQPQTFERMIPRPDKQGVCHTLVHYVPEIIDGITRGFYVIAHDVTELVEGRQRLAAAVRENENLLGIINEQLLCSVADPKGILLDVNANLCRTLGYRREELLGQSQRVLEDEIHSQGFWKTVSDSLLLGRSWRGEICHRHREGSLHWMDSLIVPFLAEDGGLERTLVLRIDISDRKAAEAERDRVNRLLSGVLASATEFAIIATDPTGLITMFNTGAERMLGYTAQEVVGRETPEIFHLPHEMAARAQALSLRTGGPVTGFRTFVVIAERDGAETQEWTYARKDGSRLQVSVVVTTIRSDDGITGYLGVAQDIGARKQAEGQLMLSKQAAEAANRAKTEFLANMSHEIRTPLNAILGLGHVLAQTPLTPQQRELLGKTQVAGQGLLAILNDILDFSRVEAGLLLLDPHPFRLADLINTVFTIVSVPASARKILVSLDMALDIPEVITGDRTRVQQVLINLLGNAVKFTPQGSVRLRISWDTRPQTLRFEVHDTGVGIEPAALPSLFEAFTQADGSTTRRFGGSGLGLAICKRLVHLMEGNIGAESEPNRGSVFWFTLPTQGHDAPLPSPPVPDAPQSAPSRTLAGVRVLIVEDNPVNQDVARRILDLEGARVTQVTNGAEALDALQAEPTAFDVVLMDAQMPVMDGYEATRRIRHTLKLGRLPIIALTAGALEVERDRAFAAGMDDFIAKPFDIDQMVAIVRRHADTSSDISPSAKAKASARAEALARLDGDEDLFEEIWARFNQEYRSEAETLRSLLSRGRGEEAARHLHALRGAASQVGLSALAQLAETAERIVRGGRLAELADALQALEAALADVLAPDVPPSGEAP
ncbi:PAS domain S-box protein [Pararhodospirillum photometricum]|uniref:histidine kinase n=1 Tax=Pararhodospirillum photometricum DSM 122 TaxID=1150469 RepID=H6SNN3_PARPM|nr:PAS domain S-box protein [Pararhodospirillum photometricum]CCG09364.1 Sensor protein [Pararhodospirillum photometricum DSM 122]